MIRTLARTRSVGLADFFDRPPPVVGAPPPTGTPALVPAERR